MPLKLVLRNLICAKQPYFSSCAHSREVSVFATVAECFRTDKILKKFQEVDISATVWIFNYISSLPRERASKRKVLISL